jgi:hypothetical protein
VSVYCTCLREKRSHGWTHEEESPQISLLFVHWGRGRAKEGTVWLADMPGL